VGDRLERSDRADARQQLERLIRAAIDPERGMVVAIASNVEFDQPGDLADAILAAWHR
jgi:hypothetical protein